MGKFIFLVWFCQSLVSQGGMAAATYRATGIISRISANTLSIQGDQEENLGVVLEFDLNDVPPDLQKDLKIGDPITVWYGLSAHSLKVLKSATPHSPLKRERGGQIAPQPGSSRFPNLPDLPDLKDVPIDDRAFYNA